MRTLTGLLFKWWVRAAALYLVCVPSRPSTSLRVTAAQGLWRTFVKFLKFDKCTHCIKAIL